MVAGGSVTVLSHPSLQGIASGSGISGSTAWHGAFRFRQYLKGIKPEDGEQPDGDLRELQFKKNQYGPLSRPLGLAGKKDTRNQGARLCRAVRTARSWRGILPFTHLAREGRMTVTIGRRKLLAALGGAVTWALAAWAQQAAMPSSSAIS